MAAHEASEHIAAAAAHGGHGKTSNMRQDILT
jgi:hypothetical protein